MGYGRHECRCTCIPFGDFHYPHGSICSECEQALEEEHERREAADLEDEREHAFEVLIETLNA